MTHDSKLGQVRLDVTTLRLQTCYGVFDSPQRAREEVFDGRQQRLLIARVDDDVAAFDEVVQPGAVVQRVHAAPAVDENNERRRSRLGSIGFENPILLIAGAVTIFRYLRVNVLLAAGTGSRLRRRRSTLKRQNGQGEEYDCDK
jgi:hypothetical protein